MNKKLFNKLREQADLEALDIYEAHPNFPKECYPSGFYTDTRDKIFAELIVRECQLRVEQYINDCGEVSSIPEILDLLKTV
ncbi:hypothetical protein UFOVP84_15 [uncultured Caudovirales phage]|uniref:Uncharacterized protein n=1 Tax=uncultured Caudovirales phage TaxID=2100421 RepID=A0A6J5KW00_9CAUD|nr:hypothetical protein UFOVP84_15 [uncultured Caudovirales phage]